MKVLLAHNFYQSSSPSGEDAVYMAEKELLEGADGVELITYERHNDEVASLPLWGKALVPMGLGWSKRTFNDISDIIKSQKPDVAHFHNIWYRISPSAYYACAEVGVPVVQTLHNYRMFCANGLLLRDGRVCEECVGRSPARSVLYGCFRESRLYSAPLALALLRHRETWKNMINAYIALTDFGRDKFIECGLDANRIFIKPNFLSSPPAPSYSHEGYALYIGRLSREKGLETLIDALGAEGLGQLPMKIIGDGPLKEPLMRRAREAALGNVEFLGAMDFPSCMRLLSGARALVLPTLCYEGFPRVIVEAFACGKPVVASGHGAMASIIQDGQNGILFTAGDPKDLSLKIKWMLDNPSTAREMGVRAREEFEAKYTSEANLEILLNIYAGLMEAN